MNKPITFACEYSLLREKNPYSECKNECQFEIKNENGAYTLISLSDLTWSNV